MALEQYLVPIEGQRANICFDCANACGGCEWSRSFLPVPGWTAYPVTRPVHQVKKVQEIHTYKVVACPQFVRG